ncbi:F-box-like domain-containing protein [Quillaja saponaria]|uniref:F-box-like domain-containing protein n=1 Tax=Quillaja saponaria TaxID=32244 RepID=A0AAD7QB00_QUISA|nr:F-box-like domain-containing protein [Quillaja saponaria]
MAERKKTTTELKRRKKQNTNNVIPYLSEDIITNILSRTPAKFVQDDARFVCKIWFNIPRQPEFIGMHLSRSTAGLYVQNTVNPKDVKYIEIKEMKKKVIHSFPPIPGEILDTYEGILLVRDQKEKEILYVVNPITKQNVKLPPAPGAMNCDRGMIGRMNTGELRIVCHDKKVLGWFVVTVGDKLDMSWEYVPYYIQTLQEIIVPNYWLAASIFVDGNVIYWTLYGLLSEFDEYGHVILILDLSNRLPGVLALPLPKQLARVAKDNVLFAKMGNDVCYTTWKNPNREFGELIVRKVEYLGFGKRPRMTTIIHIQVPEGNPIHDNYSEPITFLCDDHQQILIFRVSRKRRLFMAFDLKTEKSSIIRGVYPKCHAIGKHINSIVCWK